MKPWIVFAIVGLGLAGCSSPVDRAPPSEVFRKDGKTYEWGLAHGVTGGLFILRRDSAGHGVPYVVMTCDNRRRGAVQLRGDLAHAGPVEITARGVTFSAETILEDPSRGVGPIAEGKGYFAPDWFHALSAADVVTVSSGGRVFEAPGPGAAADHYKRYCTTLEKRQRN